MAVEIEQSIIIQTANIVDMALDNSNTKEDFIKELQKYGYKVRMGGKARTITFTTPTGIRVRNKRLIGVAKNNCSTKAIYLRLSMNDEVNNIIKYGMDLVPEKNAIEAKKEYRLMQNEWNRFARKVQKNPFVKDFLYQKYGGRCKYCGREIKDIKKMQIHHCSYENHCNFTGSIELISDSLKMKKIIVPDCENC